MNLSLRKVILLSVADFKLIFRDPSLRAFLAFPLLLFGVFIWLIPSLIVKYDFLEDYVSIFLMVGIIENTQMFCFISSMVLIDEKETGVAKAFGVVPMTKVQYLISRLLIPFLFTVLLNIVLIEIQPFYEIAWLSNIFISTLTALIVPVYVLGINTLVKNRMQGMIYIKSFNILIVLPIAAYFLPEKFSFLFGVFPTYWIFQTIENLTSDSSFIWNGFIASAFFLVLTIWISKLFIRKHFA